MRIITADICTATISGTIGSKVTDYSGFMEVLKQAIARHDFTADRIPGQALLSLPEAIPFVSAGVGRRREGQDSYIMREYRGRVSAYLRREFAAPTENSSVVVYTRSAYMVDPDMTEMEMGRILFLETGPDCSTSKKRQSS